MSACSNVNLNYGLANSQPLSQSAGNNSGNSPTSNLTGLNILGRIQADLDNFKSLRLRLTLNHAQDASLNRSQEISVEAFMANPTLNWLNLTPGQVDLKVELLGSDNQLISQIQTPISLLTSTSHSFSFDLNGGGTPKLSLSSNPNGSTGSGSGSGTNSGPGNGSGSSSSANGSESGANAPANPTASANPSNNPSSSSGSSSNQAETDLKLRTVSRTDSTATVLWEAPAGQTVTGYRILIDGKEVVANHPVANYTFSNLNRDLAYNIEIIPILANGSTLPPDRETVTKAAVSSGGGGGGGGSSGGGGTVTPPVNTPPVIVSINPSSSTLSGLGYPTRISANVTDDQTLPDSAYSWSCQNCGDASFNRTDSGLVIWTAPSTQATAQENYILTLTVNDGVNPPVSSTTTITVNHQLATVNVTGEYR